MLDPRLQIILAAKDITGAALTKFQGRIAAITKSVFSFKGALGALTGAGGIGLLVDRALDLGDSIAKTSAKLGLSAERLQEYRYAAERSGVETRTLDMALQRFTRRVAEAAVGKGELKDILEQYNIAVMDSAGNTRRTTDVFRDLADVISNTENPAERLRIAFKAFDSEGAALVNMLKNGSAGLDDYADRARKLGIILEDRLISGSERARDAVDDLGKVIQTNFSRVVLENVESLTSAVEQLAEALGKVAKYAGLRSITSTGYQAAALLSNEEYERFRNADLFERQRILDEALAARGISETGAGGQTVIRKNIPPGQRSAPAATGGGYLPPGIGGVTNYPMYPSLRDTERARTTTTEAERVGGIFGVPIGSEYGVDFAGGFERSFESIDAIMQEYDEKEREISDSLTDFFAEIDNTVVNTNEKWIELTEHTAGAMQQNFSDLFFDTMRGEFKSLEDYSNAILDSISRAVSDFLSQELVQGLFGSLSKSGGGGGWIGQLIGAIAGGASAKGNIFTPGGIRRFASGGLVTDPTLFAYAGGLGLMGERGPEAILPLGRNRRGELGVRSGSGGGNNFYINVTAPRGRIERESMNQLTTKLGLAVRRAVRRNG